MMRIFSPVPPALPPPPEPLPLWSRRRLCRRKLSAGATVLAAARVKHAAAIAANIQRRERMAEECRGAQQPHIGDHDTRCHGAHRGMPHQDQKPPPALNANATEQCIRYDGLHVADWVMRHGGGGSGTSSCAWSLHTVVRASAEVRGSKVLIQNSRTQTKWPSCNNKRGPFRNKFAQKRAIPVNK